MVIFLSTGLVEKLSKELIRGGYSADTPAAIVYIFIRLKTAEFYQSAWSIRCGLCCGC